MTAGTFRNRGRNRNSSLRPAGPRRVRFACTTCGSRIMYRWRPWPLPARDCAAALEQPALRIPLARSERRCSSARCREQCHFLDEAVEGPLRASATTLAKSTNRPGANPGAILPPASAEVNILLPSVPPLGASRQPVFQCDVAERPRLFQLFQSDREPPETTEILFCIARHRHETCDPDIARCSAAHPALPALRSKDQYHDCQIWHRRFRLP